MQHDLVLYDFSRSSSYFKILRATGWMIRFIDNMRSRKAGKAKTRGELTIKEIGRAEVFLVSTVQKEVFHEEYEQLNEGTRYSY